jgi:hypothetical protein
MHCALGHTRPWALGWCRRGCTCSPPCRKIPTGERQGCVAGCAWSRTYVACITGERLAALTLRTLCKACACARSSRCDMCKDAPAASTRSRNGELPIGVPPTVASATYAAALVSTSAAVAAERGGGVRLRGYMRACNTVQCKAMQCRWRRNSVCKLRSVALLAPMEQQCERTGLSGREERGGHHLGYRPLRPVAKLIEHVHGHLQRCTWHIALCRVALWRAVQSCHKRSFDLIGSAVIGITAITARDRHEGR